MQLNFEFCSSCGLIRRGSLGKNRHDYHDYTEDSRITGRRLAGYATDIVRIVQERGVTKQALVVEVGANDGAFLDLLDDAGYTNLLSVDPSRHCAAICRSKGHQVENVHLAEEEASRIRKSYGPARAVICRHTLEHVSDPLELLKAMRVLLDNEGLLCIEVPDAHRITRDLQGHELWEEHLYYFTLESLLPLLSRGGFRVIDASVVSDRRTSNLLLVCVSQSGKNEQLSAMSEGFQDLELCRSFAARWELLCQRLHAAIATWPTPIVCIGASHLQSNFLLFTGLGHSISTLVDDDPVKVHRYIPVPQPVPVLSTQESLECSSAGTVVRSAFGYPDWMRSICEPLAARGAYVVDPYLVPTECDRIE